MNSFTGGVLLSNKRVSADQGIRVSWAWYNLSTGTVKWTFKNDYTEEKSFILFRNGYYFGNAFWCFRPDEIILGDNKAVSEYCPGDTVLGRTGFVKVISAGRRWNSDGLFRIMADGMLPLDVTPNHPVFTTVSSAQNEGTDTGHFEKPRYVEAFKLVEKTENNSGNYVVMPIPEGNFRVRSLNAAVQKKGSSVSKKNKMPLNEDTSWLMGLYCAYGLSCKSKRNIIHFSMKMENEGIYYRMKKILEDLGLKAIISRRGEGKITGIEIDGEFLERLETWIGNSVYKRHMPDFILYHRNRSIPAAFLDGVMTGIRCIGKNKDGNTSIRTRSRVLAEQLQLAWLRFGRFAPVYVQRGKKNSVQEKNTFSDAKYQVKLFSSAIPNGMEVNFAGKYVYIPIKGIQRIPYTGWVYDLKTEDESIVAGNIVTHNCVYISNTGFNTAFATKLAPLVNNGVEKNSPPLAVVNLGGKYIVAFLFTLSPGQTWSMLEGGFSESSQPSNYSGITVNLTGPESFCVRYDEKQVRDWDLQTGTQLAGYTPNPSTFLSLLAHSNSSFVSLFSDEIKEGECSG